MIEPIIKKLTEKKLIGKYMTMTLANDSTAELWKSFMPRRKEIRNTIGTDLFSMQVYPELLKFNHFTPDISFEKWAVVEVKDFSTIPADMEPYILPEGLYAVFLYKGDPRNFAPAFQYIFETWLPDSDYQIDNRPHFEILGEKYKNNHPDSEEEIWIPVKLN
jgi:AraC family transcriptional regulator